MSLNFLKTIKNAIKYWYLQLIVGLIFIGVGFWTFTTPLESYVALTFIFSISFIIAGISEMYFAIENREELDNWGWTLALGILGVIIGVMLLFNPDISAATLPFYVGFVVLFRSIYAIGASIDLKSYKIMDWGYLMAVGVIGVVFSIILLWNPNFAGMTLIFWTAMLFIIAGIFSVYLSLKLKKINDMPNKISSDLRNKFEEIKNKIQEQLSEGDGVEKIE